VTETTSPAPRPGDLTQGRIDGHLLRISLFMAVSAIGMQMISAIDAFFVARLGSVELAALTFSFPILMVIASISYGLSASVMAFVGRKYGEGGRESLRVINTDAVLLGAMVVVVLTAVAYPTVDPLLRALGAAPEVLPSAGRYMRIWYIATLPTILLMVCNGVSRIHSSGQLPAGTWFLVMVLTFILDPVLIFGFGPIPAMGLDGAAWASVIARTIAFAVAFYVAHYRMHLFAPIALQPARLMKSWNELLHVAVPAAATQLVIPVSAALLTGVVATLGTVAVGAYGIASRVELVILTHAAALSAAMGPVVAQNAGARAYDRVRASLSHAARWGTAISLALAVVVFLGADTVAHWLADDPEIGGIVAMYLRIVPVSYAFACLIMVHTSSLYSLGLAGSALVINIARAIVINLPLAYLGAALAGISGVFFAIVATTVLVGAVSSWWMARVLRRLAAS